MCPSSFPRFDRRSRHLLQAANHLPQHLEEGKGQVLVVYLDVSLEPGLDIGPNLIEQGPVAGSSQVHLPNPRVSPTRSVGGAPLECRT